MRKPTRKVRRFIRKRAHRKGKGKGSGKRPTGKGIWTYTMNLSDDAYEELYFGGRGKGKGRGKRAGKRSTGKGSGRDTNPLGRDGEPLKCSIPNCQSTTHLWRNCPLKGKGKGSGPPSSQSSRPSYFTGHEIFMINVEEAPQGPPTVLGPTTTDDRRQPAPPLTQTD